MHREASLRLAPNRFECDLPACLSHCVVSFHTDGCSKSPRGNCIPKSINEQIKRRVGSTTEAECLLKGKKGIVRFEGTNYEIKEQDQINYCQTVFGADKVVENLSFVARHLFVCFLMWFMFAAYLTRILSLIARYLHLLE